MRSTRVTRFGVWVLAAAGLTLVSSCSSATEATPETDDASGYGNLSDAPERYKLQQEGLGGGIVFYVSRKPFPCGPALTGVCNYLEVAPFDSEVLRSWSNDENSSTDVPDSEGSAIGTGWVNTLAIIEQGNTDPDVSAAAYADAYEHNGVTDWYLPSKDELFELYEHRKTVGASEQNNYWTSSGYDLNTVWNQSFVEGPQHRRLKFDKITVRPVRAF